ncbi:hypothetical protein KDA00_04275 [Candidatus Saccharibacteria bacterium]|nr:hypothetical protein [Candidatus Saccharibacteria bacterium]
MSSVTQELDPRIRIDGFATPTADDIVSLDRKLQRERGWYTGLPRFSTNQEIEEAILEGTLVEVTTTADLHPIQRFRDRREVFIPAVSRNALKMRSDFSKLWRYVLGQSGIFRSDIRLAETSFVRSEAYQAELLDRGKLASPDSTHCTGNAIDIDNSGYYRMTAEGFISVGDPRRQTQQKETLQKFGEQMDGHEYSYDYDPRIMDAAYAAADLLHREGVINLVCEFSGTPNATLHMAASPDYSSPDIV